MEEHGDDDETMERSDNVEVAGVSRNSQPLHGIKASDS